MPQPLIAELGGLGVQFIEAYGMTEASPQIATTGWRPTSSRCSVGRAAGPEVAIVGNGSPLPVGLEGEVVIRGARYDGGDEANRVRVGWPRTGDLGDWTRTGFVHHRAIRCHQPWW
jgi:long-subunit acyl-CoA synthetase (AMP-forming)